MKRRTVLSGTLLGGAYIATSALGSPQPATAVATSTFLAQTGDSLQDAIVVGDTIYAVVTRMVDRQPWVTAHSAADAALPARQHALPQARYLATGVHPDGSLLIQAMGYSKTASHHLLKLHLPSGEITIVAEIPAGGRLFYAGNGRFIRIHESGHLEKLDATEPRPAMRHIANLDAVFGSTVHVQPLDPSSLVAIVDQHTGTTARVDLDCGAIETLDMASPELAASLAFYESIVRNHPPGKPPIHPQVVTAIGANGARSVSVLLSPYKSDGRANMLSFSATGKTLTPAQIVLPHRTTVGNPFKLARLQNRFAVLFSGGSYALYDL